MEEKVQDMIDSFLAGSYCGNEVYQNYLKRLGSSTADQLSKEPVRLKSDKEKLQEQTQELAFANYKTFIQTADCSRELFSKFTKTENTVDSIISKLPRARKECQDIANISEIVEMKKKQNQLVLARSEQLLDVLELPQLMDSCIKKGLFEEALELFSHVRRLGAKHGQIPIVANIVSELEGSWKSMIHELLDQLRTDIPLPKCLQIIGFLRRMNVFSDPELRLKFLQARDTWLKKMLTSVTVAKGESISAKKLELLRVHLFSIVTQHRAIFSDEECVNAGDDLNEPCIFYSWLVDKIQQILTVLEEGTASKQVASSFDSLLGQAMYFGMSFSRVGADFRGLGAWHMQRALLQNTETAIRRIGKKFEQDMDRYVLGPSNLPPLNVDQGEGPPLVLLDYPPLAELTNRVLRIFNDLRGCTPLAIADGVNSALQDLFRGCSKVIYNFYRQEQTSLGPSERVTLSKFCSAYQLLIQHVSTCFGQLFPISDLSKHLGIPIHQLQLMGLFSLKEELLVEPISALLVIE